MSSTTTVSNNIQIILVMLIAMAMAITLPAFAQEESTSVKVDLNQNTQVADLSLGKTQNLRYDGVVEIKTTGVATVYLEVDVPVGWEGTISPESATVTNERLVDFEGFVTVFTGEASGEYDVRVTARVEITGEYPARWASDTMSVEVVTNRVAIEVLEPKLVNITQSNITQSQAFSFRIKNLGTTADTMALKFDDGIIDLENRGWRFWKDKDVVDLEARSSYVMTIDVEIPANSEIGSNIITVSVESDVTGQKSSAYATVNVIKGSPVATPAKEWQFLGLGLATWLMIMVGVMVLGMSIFITGTEVGFFGFLIYILVPLYCRIKREKVLDNFLRGQIYGYIKANPGTHYMEIQHELDIKNGVLAHHLQVLEREKFIKIYRDGLYKRFYPMHVKIKKKGRHLSRIQKDIVEHIGNHPGINQKHLSRYLDESKQVINYHVKILTKAKVIRVERDGNVTKLFLPKERTQEIEESKDEEPAIEVEPLEISALQRQ
jgi:predicted transcriptional regulator